MARSPDGLSTQLLALRRTGCARLRARLAWDVLIRVLSAFCFAVLTSHKRDLRHRRKIGRPEAREFRQRLAQAHHLIDGSRAGGKTGISSAKRLQTMIGADKTHLNAVGSSIKQRASRRMVLVTSLG